MMRNINAIHCLTSIVPFTYIPGLIPIIIWSQVGLSLFSRPIIVELSEGLL